MKPSRTLCQTQWQGPRQFWLRAQARWHDQNGSFSHTSSEWIHRGRTISSQKRVDAGDLQLILPSKIHSRQFKTSVDLVFHSRTRPHGVDPSETGWKPANFQICRFKKLWKLSIRCEWWIGAKTATHTAWTSKNEFVSSRTVSRHGSQP
jgi:hypothetical protein